MKHAGFSLMELLVVISIIALLASMLLPAISMVRKLSRATVCMSGMRQMGLAFAGYAGEWEGMYPGKYATNNYGDTPYRSWFGGLLPYLENEVTIQAGKGIASKAYICPDGSIPKRTQDAWGINYGYNSAYAAFPWNSYPASSIANGSQLYLVLERLGRQPAGNADWNWNVSAPWVFPTWLPGQSYINQSQQRISHRGRSNCLFYDLHVASETPIMAATQVPNPWLGK